MCASVFYCTVTRNKLVIKLCKSERASSLVRARDLGFGPNGPNFTEILPFRLGPRQNKIGQNFLVQFEFYTQSTSLQTSLHISRKKHTLRLNSQFIPTIHFFNHTNQTRMTFIEKVLQQKGLDVAPAGARHRDPSGRTQLFPSLT